MERISVIENDGNANSWFDASKATRYEERTCWNGQNNVSLNTKANGYHEAIYETLSHAFILHKYSSVLSSRDTYQLISEQEAAQWFIDSEYNGEEIPRSLINLIYNCEIF